MELVRCEDRFSSEAEPVSNRREVQGDEVKRGAGKDFAFLILAFSLAKLSCKY